MADTDSEKPPYAGFWRRAAAIAVDIVILCIVGVVMQYLHSDIQLQDTLYPLVLAAYFIGLEGGKWRASLGKKLLRIEVGGRDGEKAPLPNIIARYLAYIVPALPFTWISMTGNYAIFVDTLLHIDERMGPGSHKLFLQTPESHDILFKLVHAFLFYLATRFVLFILPIIMTSEKTGLHDWISRTRVYKRPAAEKPSAEEPVAEEDQPAVNKT